MPSYLNCINLLPSSTTSITFPTKSPSPNEISVPTLHFLPGLTNVSQTSFSFLFNNNTSIFASVPTLLPKSLAGITFVLLITRQSPLCKYLTISLNI